MKGISLVERHFEKALLVLVAFAIGSFILFDFLNPTTIKMGTQSDATSNMVNQLLLAKAKSLKASQESSQNTMELQPIVIGAAQKNFSEKLSATISPSLKIRESSPSFSKEILNPTIKLLDTVYYQPHFAAPTMVSPVEWLSDAFEPEAASKNEPLQKFIDAQAEPKTMDVIWTKPMAQVNLKDIRTELAKAVAKATPPQIAAPASWRNNTIYIIDVVFERQTQMADGTWGDLVTVPIMLGKNESSFRNRDINGWDANKIFAEMRGSNSIEMEIRQPEFYATMHKTGSKASASSLAKPSAVVGDQAAEKKKQQDIVKLKEQVDELEKELKAKESELQSAGGEWDADISKKEAERKKSIKKKPGEDASDNESSSTDYKLRTRLTQTVRDLRNKIKRLQSQPLGIEIFKKTIATDVKPAEGAIEPDLDFIDVWTHDLSVTFGRTVRYRCHVDIFNPFFGRGRQLSKEQIGLAKSLTISSEPSEWSAPLNVPSKVMFFADGGTLGEKNGRQSAVFSVYFLKQGLWRNPNQNPSFEVGQPLLFSFQGNNNGADGAISADIQTGLFVADIFDDLNAMPEKSRSTLPGVVLGQQDQSGKFSIHYPTKEKLDPIQATLKKLVEQGKNAPPSGKPAS